MEAGGEDDRAVRRGVHPLADDAGGGAVGALAPGDVLAGQRALEVARDAGVPALGGRVVVEVAVLQHVGGVGAGGVAQRGAGGEGRELVLAADLVEEREHLLLAGGLVGDLARGLGGGGKGDEGGGGDEAEKELSHTFQIEIRDPALDPRKPARSHPRFRVAASANVHGRAPATSMGTAFSSPRRRSALRPAPTGVSRRMATAWPPSDAALDAGSPER